MQGKKGCPPEEAKDLLRGVINIQFTPFRSVSEIDEGALRDNTRFMIEAGIVTGTGAQVIGGSNGEGFSLSDAEFKRLIDVVVDEAKGRVPVIVACLRLGTMPVVDLARYAQQAGADALLILPPLYYPNPSDEVILSHFREVAGAVDISIMIYNHPGITGKDMSVDCLMHLAEIDSIVALKETTGNMGKLREVAYRLGDRFAINANTYRVISPLDFQFGIVGHNNFIGNYDPKTALEVTVAAAGGDFRGCQQIWKRFLKLNGYVFSADMYRTTSFGKEMARIVGRPMGDVERLPLKRPDEKEREKLKQMMIQAGIAV